MNPAKPLISLALIHHREQLRASITETSTPAKTTGGVNLLCHPRARARAFLPRFNPFYHPYAREGQAVDCPLLRRRSPTRSVAPKQHRGLGRASLRHFGLARGAEESGAA